MGDLNRAQEQVLELIPLPLRADLADDLDAALSNLYTLGVQHGEAEADSRWEERTQALRLLARRVTEFVASDDVEEAYDRMKAALDAWWRERLTGFSCDRRPRAR